MSMTTSYGLDHKVRPYLVKDYQVVDRTETYAVLVRRKRPNHAMHAILSVLTAGMWLMVWLVLALLSRNRYVTLTVRPDGTVRRSKSTRGPS